MKANEFNMINNVIKKDDYKERVNAVFQDVALILSETLGPYGTTITMEKTGDIAFTKDGWNALKKISYMDEVQDRILGLLVKIAGRVNLAVGDGTTTSIVSADQLLQIINELLVTYKHLRPKDFLDKLESVIERICYRIQENAVKIDKDGNLDEIYNLAMVSTNGETKVAEMIQAIYKETGNPSIEFTKSKSTETTYEVVNGYKLRFMTYIDRIFINNDNNTCDIKSPMVLMLNHKIEQDYYEKIILPTVALTVQEGRRLVVVAPFYDSHLLQKFSRLISNEFKATKSTTVVYARASLMNNHTHDLFNDFSALVGAQVISEQTAYEIIKGDLEYKPEEFVGYVDRMIIGEDSTYISGFTNKNESLVEILTNDAESKYNQILENCSSNEIISEELINAKQRISKLRCKMGTINVGGSTELAKNANYDLVEDAIKACESSYLYGYVPGQNISIQTSIDDMLKMDMPKDTFDILLAVKKAFMNVTKIMLKNKFDNDVDSLDMCSIIEHCITDQCVVDVNSSDIYDVTYTDAVINSCRTDIEILRAAISIIGLVLSSSHYISIR